MTAKRMSDTRRERLEAMRHALRLPHTAEQLAARFGVDISTIHGDLGMLRAAIIANNDEDPPTYRLANKRDRHEPDVEVRCDCGAVWRGIVVTVAARNIAAHAKRGEPCRVHPPTARTDSRYRELHRNCQSAAHYAVRGDGLEGA